jgi:CubicO group peptidase (beta-lactamase class C family)
MAELPAAERAVLDRVVDAAFDGATYGGITWGVIVVQNGKIVAERYDADFGVHVGHQTHSAAKSFASTLVGIATEAYRLDIKRSGALEEWRKPGDPRGQITVEHLLHMSSGLYGEGGGSPQSDIYYQGATVEGRAVNNHLDSLPGTRFLYNPPDTMLLLRAVRQAVNDDEKFLLVPFEELFWKIGMTRTVTSSDWNGDFLDVGPDLQHGTGLRPLRPPLPRRRNLERRARIARRLGKLRGDAGPGAAAGKWPALRRAVLALRRPSRAAGRRLQPQRRPGPVRHDHPVPQRGRGSPRDRRGLGVSNREVRR